MRVFLFLRHGETDWNVARRMQGQIVDIPLNATGERQAVGARDVLSGTSIDRIISSHQKRAGMTAEIVADGRNIPIISDPRLAERGWGDAEGKTYDELLDLYPDSFVLQDGRVVCPDPFSCHPQGSETFDEVADRALLAVFEFLDRYPDQNFLFVSHEDTLTALVKKLTGRDMTFANAVPYKAVETSEGWVIEPLDNSTGCQSVLKKDGIPLTCKI